METTIRLPRRRSRLDGACRVTREVVVEAQGCEPEMVAVRALQPRVHARGERRGEARSTGDARRARSVGRLAAPQQRTRFKRRVHRDIRYAPETAGVINRLHRGFPVRRVFELADPAAAGFPRRLTLVGSVGVGEQVGSSDRVGIRRGGRIFDEGSSGRNAVGRGRDAAEAAAVATRDEHRLTLDRALR